jgi:hypothetical protein
MTADNSGWFLKEMPFPLRSRSISNVLYLMYRGRVTCAAVA